MLLWCMRQNQTWYDTVELEFDPSTSFHTYRLAINEDGYEEGVGYIYFNKN